MLKQFISRKLPYLTPSSYGLGASNYKAQFTSLQSLDKVAPEIIDRASLRQSRKKDDLDYEHFCQNLMKMLQFQKQRERKATERDSQFRKVAITSLLPLRESLLLYEAFQPRQFDDDHVASSIFQIAKIVRINSDRPIYYKDMTRKELLDDWRFEDLIKDIEYAVLPGVVSSHDNIVKMLEGLITLKYKEGNLQKRFIDKLERILKKQDKYGLFELEEDDITNIPLPQYGKDGFYQDTHYSVATFMADPKAKYYINRLFKEVEDKNTQRLEAKNREIDQEAKEFERVLNSLSKNIGLLKDSHNEIAESILAVREQYYQLTQAQQREYIILNKTLNNELLELEEILIEAGLITPLDLVDLTNLTDQQKNKKNAENILKTLITDLTEFNSRATWLDHHHYTALDNSNQHSEYETTPMSDKYYRKLAENWLPIRDYSRMLACACRLANIDQNPNLDPTHSNKNWETLMFNTQPKENLEGKVKIILDTVYSSEYQYTLNHLLKYQDQTIEALKNIDDIDELAEACGNIAFSYGLFGINKVAKVALELGSTRAVDISTFEKRSFINCLRGINGTSGVDNTPFHQPVIEYTTKHLQEFSFGDLLYIAQYYVVHSLHNDASFPSLMQALNTYYVDNAFTDISVEYRRILGDIELFFLTLTDPIVDSKGNEVKLSNNLTIAARYPQHATTDHVETVDPVKDAILKSFKINLNSKFSNLVSHSITQLPEQLQPSFYYPSGNKKIIAFLGRDDVVSRDQNTVSFINQWRFDQINKLSPDVECRAISYYNIVDIDYENAKIKFKQPEIIENIIREMQQETESTIALRQIGESLTTIEKKVLEHARSVESVKSAKVLHRAKNFYEKVEPLVETLYSFFNTFKDYQQVFEHHQKNLYANNLKIQLAKLNDSFAQLEKKQQEMVEKLSNEKAGGKTFKQLLKQIQQDITNQQKELNLDKSKSIVYKWVGTMFGDELVIDKTQSYPAEKKDINIEIVNHNFIWDNSYFNYPSWKKLIEERSNPITLNLSIPMKTTNFTVSNRIGVIPDARHSRNYLKPFSFPWNWEIYAYRYPKELKKEMVENDVKHLAVAPKFDKSIQQILSMQNLSFEMRNRFNAQELGDLLVNFEFLEDIMNHQLGKKALEGGSTFCNRNPEDYFTFLERISSSWFMRDSYRNFFVERHTRKSKIEMARKEYKFKAKKLLEEHHAGDYDYHEYLNRINGLKNELGYYLRDFLEDYNDHESFFGDQFKTHKFETNPETLYDPYAVKQWYSYKKDPDFVRSEKDVGRMLDIKRRKAETKLIKLRIIKKLHENASLSSIEKEYVKKWRKAIEDSNLSDMDMIMVNERMAMTPYQQLSQKDKEFFEDLDFVHTPSIQEIALNDLILEIATLYDDGIISKIENGIKNKQIAKEWDAEINIFETEDFSQEYYILKTSINNYIWNEAAKYGEKDIKNLNDLFAVLRGYTGKDRVFLEVDTERLNEFIKEYNKDENRDEKIVNWIKQYEERSKREYRVFTSKELLRAFRKYQEAEKKHLYKRAQRSMKIIFNSEYEEISHKSIHIFVENLIERIYLLKKFNPNQLKVVFTGILAHPNTNKLDKNNLIAILRENELFDEDYRAYYINENHNYKDEFAHDVDLSIPELKKRFALANTQFVESVTQKFTSI